MNIRINQLSFIAMYNTLLNTSKKNVFVLSAYIEFNILYTLLGMLLKSIQAYAWLSKW